MIPSGVIKQRPFNGERKSSKALFESYSSFCKIGARVILKLLSDVRGTVRHLESGREVFALCSRESAATSFR